LTLQAAVSNGRDEVWGALPLDVQSAAITAPEHEVGHREPSRVHDEAAAPEVRENALPLRFAPGKETFTAVDEDLAEHEPGRLGRGLHAIREFVERRRSNVARQIGSQGKK